MAWSDKQKEEIYERVPWYRGQGISDAKDLSPEEQAELAAWLRYCPDRDKRLNQNGIAHLLRKPRASIKPILEYAEDQGLFRISLARVGSLRAPKRNPDLEQGLQEHFPQVREFIVLETNHGRADEYNSADDDALHEELGRGAAAYWLKPVLISGLHVGVGGGRGPAYACSSLQREASHLRRLSKVRITTLTGDMGAADHAGTEIRDASHAAYSLYTSLGPQAELRALRFPVVCGSPGERNTFLTSSTGRYIFDGRWELEKHEYIPDLGVIGIGALQGGHRFLEKSADPTLQPIKGLLTGLEELVAQGKQMLKEQIPDYCAVRDVCNWLLPALPAGVTDVELAHIAQFKPFMQKVKDCLDYINKHIMSVSPEQLRKIPNIVAVAGGYAKRDAIYTALTQEPVVVDALCTDAATARRLLRRNRST